MGPRPQLFLDEVLLFGEALLGAPAEQLALRLPTSLLESPDLPLAGGGFHPDPVEEAAGLCAWIIRDRLFGDGSRSVGYVCMGALLERDFPWPRSEEVAKEIARTLKAYEAGRITKARFVDWVRSWVAQADR
jgi:hypothetical protein